MSQDNVEPDLQPLMHLGRQASCANQWAPQWGRVPSCYRVSRGLGPSVEVPASQPEASATDQGGSLDEALGGAYLGT